MKARKRLQSWMEGVAGRSMKDVMCFALLQYSEL